LAKRLTFNEKHLGNTVSVLAEEIVDGVSTGLTDNYLRVRYAAAPETTVNHFDNVRITSVREDGAEGAL
jgi:hypothetical protein